MTSQSYLLLDTQSILFYHFQESGNLGSFLIVIFRIQLLFNVLDSCLCVNNEIYLYGNLEQFILIILHSFIPTKVGIEDENFPVTVFPDKFPQR